MVAFLFRRHRWKAQALGYSKLNNFKTYSYKPCKIRLLYVICNIIFPLPQTSWNLILWEYSDYFLKETLFNLFTQNALFLLKTWRKPGANFVRLRLRLRKSFRDSQPQPQPMHVKQNESVRVRSHSRSFLCGPGWPEIW